MMLADIDFCSMGDIEEILEVERNGGADRWSRKIIMEDFRERYGNIIYMIARSAFVPCGIVVFERSYGVLKILKLDVVESWRRRGVGSQLLTASGTVGEALGCCRMELNVRKVNKSAISFYRAVGFRLSGRMPRYYSNGDDALGYRISLPLCVEGISR